MKRHKTLTIRTPEGIAFSLDLAGPLIRFLALALDKAIVYVFSTVLSTVLGLARVISADLAGAVWMIASFVLSIGYPIAFEWFMQGQTPGKKLFRLQVMDEQGLHLKFSQIVVRNLLRFVDALPAFYFVGGAACLATARAQRVGDVAANTIVIRRRQMARPDLDQVLPDKYNSFRAYPHLAARLRQNVTPREAGLALQALLRRDRLEDDARLKIFAEIRRHMEQVVRFPSEITDGVSDERYVRNVVDLLFRSPPSNVSRTASRNRA